MFVEMVGKNDGDVSWFRRLGTYGFDFTYSKKNATNLTKEEADKVLSRRDFYLKMYGAKNLVLSE